MSLRPDHKALLFVGAIAVLGAGVRVVRAATQHGATSAQPALETQLAAADSARVRQSKKKTSGGRGRGRGRRAPEVPGDPVGRGENPTPSRVARGRVNGKLDLDVATAAQIDSLPGISPGIAKRIVADRMAHGPFLSKDGLQRVSGLGPKFLSRIDTLVVFSGVFTQSEPSDTLIPRAKKSVRARKSRP